MKKHILLLSTLFLVVNYTTAQVTFNKSDVLNRFDDTSGLNTVTLQLPGDSGMDMTWDFSSLGSGQFDEVHYLNSANTPWKDSFTFGSDYAFNSQQGAYFEFYGADDDSLFLSGSITISGNDTLVVDFSDPQVAMQFPFTYKTAYVDEYAYEYAFGSAYYKTSGTLTVSVDAWGDVKLPWGTVENVLRVHYLDERVDSTFTGLDTTEGLTTIDRYVWIKPGYSGTILFTALYETPQGTFGGTSYMTEETFRLNVQHLFAEKINLNIYPNPISSSQQLTITYNSNIEFDIDEIIIKDITGKTVLSTSTENDINTTKVDISNLTSGMYYVTIRSGDAIVTKKLTVY